VIKGPTLSVIVPTYNEREIVRQLVDRLCGALRDVPFEILFVDDSCDGTDQVIAELARKDPRIRLRHRPARHGLATAVVEGISLAQGEICCVLDADLQHPPECLPLLLCAMNETDADVVVGSRYVAGGSYRTLTRGRRLASWVATAVARLLLRRARLVADPMSGFFAFRRSVVQGVQLSPVGYKILLEILVRGKIRKVAEVPYTFNARAGGRSKLTWRQNWEYLVHVVRLLGVQPDDLRFLRFGSVGASGVMVNSGVLWALVRAGLHYSHAGVAAIGVATTWNFCWNDLFTWRDRRSRSLARFAERYVRYWAITGVGSAFHYVLLLGLTSLGVPYLVSNLVGIGAAALWNFHALGEWNWSPTEKGVMRVVWSKPIGSGSQAARL